MKRPSGKAANLTLPFETDLGPEHYAYGERSSGETHGVVLTKPHVVELILDLAGYRSDRNLSELTLLEPSCGRGAFLVPAVRRLMASRRRHRTPSKLDSAICAFDIDEEHVNESRAAVAAELMRSGVPKAEATRLAAHWVRKADFLLATFDRRFDVAVGNPPYIRIEQISETLQAEYRSRYTTLFDRADMYVAFIERALSLLSNTGTLSFICADRWTLNKYGAPLRALIAERYRTLYYIDLHDASPFDSDVIAYPAIFAFTRGPSKATRVAKLLTASPEECEAVAHALLDSKKSKGAAVIDSYPKWFGGEEPWVLTSPQHLSLLRDLEEHFEPLETRGRARVGIGVATGNDRVFIVKKPIDIEPDRLVPLVMREDIELGKINNGGRWVINAFGSDGSVIDLKNFPRLARYFESHADSVRARHVAQKNPGRWFRTIDRVYPELVSEPKLLIPDIAGSNEVAFEAGHYHPHHNLYFVTSKVWDLEVLGALLSSRVALFFVWSYAVKMRGSYLRFQAQYIRRIRVPDPSKISKANARSLRLAFRRRDFKRIDALSMAVYELKNLPEFAFVDTRK
jgi:adenine-specific DNA-methyltransferase